MAQFISIDRTLEVVCDLKGVDDDVDTRMEHYCECMNLVSIAIEHGATDTQLIASLLYSAIHDKWNDITRAQIKKQFGNKVLTHLDGCFIQNAA